MMKLLLASLLILAATQPAQSAETLTGETLYEAFNLRSIHSSLGQQLKANCHVYLKDFFDSEENTRITKRPDGLIIETTDWHYEFKVRQNSDLMIVEFTDNAKFSTYFSRSKITLEKSSEHEWFATISETLYPNSERRSRHIHQSDWIEPPADCK